MSTTVGSVKSVSFGQQTTAPYMDFLRATNPEIDQLLAKNPGVKTFLDRMDAIGAVVHGPVGNQVVTDHQWSAWSHSPRSAGLPPDWRDEIVILFQTDTDPNHVLDFGREKFQASVIGVFTKGQIFTKECVTTDPRTGQEMGFANDAGFESVMKVRTVGIPGEKAGVAFATGMMDTNGKPAGWWGWPSNYNFETNRFPPGMYGGRQVEFTHGTADHFPIDDHGEKQVLKRKASFAPGEAPFVYEDYQPPRVETLASDAVEPTNVQNAVKKFIGSTPSNRLSTGNPTPGNNPLNTRIRNQ